MLEVKFEVMSMESEDMADNAMSVVLFERIQMYCQGNSWKANINTHEKSDCDEKHENVPEEVMSVKNFTLKKLSETFYNTESVKD